MRLIVILSLLFASGCSTYKPVIDTAGRSGTFNSDRAKEITNDTNLCHLEIEKHINLVSNIWHYIWDQDGETKYKTMMKTCMTNRGHSVLF